MSKKEKRLRKIRQNPKNVTFDELRITLEDHGFVMRGGKATSHYFFSAEVGERFWRLSIPFKKPHILINYVKDALDAIDEIRAVKSEDLQEDQEDKGDDE
jgi:hypothetical protein